MNNYHCTRGHHVRTSGDVCPALVQGEPCDGELRPTSSDPRNALVRVAA